MSGLSKEEIEVVYKKGRKISTKYFLVYFLSSLDFKCSAVVSKKISKKAVVRNKIKRRIRHLATLFLDKGLFIVKPKIDISNLEFEKLKNDFKKICDKID